MYEFSTRCFSIAHLIHTNASARKERREFTVVLSEVSGDFIMNVRTSGGEEFERLIKPIAIVSRLVSIWPLDRDRTTVVEHLRVCHRIFMLLISGTMSGIVTADVVRNFADLDTATECALIASAFYLSFVRIVNYTVHREDMVYVVETMRKDWLEATPEDLLVLKEKCHMSFILAKQFIVTVLLALGLFMLVPMLDIVILHYEERILPFRGYIFENQISSPHYEYLYVCTALAGGLTGTTIASATSFNLVSTMHGAARFAILQKRLEALRSDDPECNAVMVDCVKRHQDAIKFADALERIINVLALGQFVISTGLVCCAGFQITSMVADKGRLMKYCSFLNSAILELFLFSISGQQLIVESLAVGDSAFAAEWVGSSFSKSLRILMLRTTVPSKITAAKFYDMSLQSFTSVLSTSFSYFTVLQAMNEE